MNMTDRAQGWLHQLQVVDDVDNARGTSVVVAAGHHHRFGDIQLCTVRVEALIRIVQKVKALRALTFSHIVK